MSLVFMEYSHLLTVAFVNVIAALLARDVRVSVPAMDTVMVESVSVMWHSVAANVKCLAVLERYMIVLYMDPATVLHKHVFVYLVST